MLTSKLFSAADKLAYTHALLKVKNAKLAHLNNESWAQWSERAIPNQSVRQALTALGRVSTYANAPSRIRASAVLRQLQAVFGEGVLYLDHGWQQIVNALVEKAVTVGVELTLGQVVNQIDVGPDGCKVGLREQVVSAENLILAVPPQAAAALLPQSKQLASAIAQQIPVKAACLTLGLRSLPNPKLTYAMGIDRPLYYSLHTAAATLAPAGQHLVHLAYYRSSQSDEDANAIRSELEDLMQRLQPGWRDAVVTEEFLPAITVYHALPQAALPRPAVVLADAPNCYVIGDWVEVDDMLADASFNSAQVAASEILAHRTVAEAQRVAVPQPS